MNQSPASSSMPKTPIATTSPNLKAIFEKAREEYTKKTKVDLTAHPLTAELQKCDSPAAVVTILEDRIDEFRKSQSGDERLQKWLNPTINVLYAFSATLGQGIGLVNIIMIYRESRVNIDSTGFLSCPSYFCWCRRPSLGQCSHISTCGGSCNIGDY